MLAFPFLLIFSHIVLWIRLGPLYSLAIFLMTILLTLILVVMISCAKKFIHRGAKYNDERIRLIADSVVGIKTIKCFNREEKYEQIIN